MDDAAFGHSIQDRLPDHFRVGFVNYGGFTTDAIKKSAKDKKLLAYINKYKLDTVGINETNCHWRRIPVTSRLPERTRGWFEHLHRSTASFEEYEGQAGLQFGGVTLWSMNQSSHRVGKEGRDPTGLGRWAWTWFRGKESISIRAITAYRPCKNTAAPGSVWNQQKTFFEDKNDDRCPCKAFTEDLAKQLTTWMAAGDQIVLGLDVNEDIRDGSFRDAMTTLGLVEIMSHTHGLSLPRTQNRGSRPIDGIWVSPTLVNCRCGYLPFEFDHRLMWIDIPHTLAFGHQLPQLTKAIARRLKLFDPRIKQRYLELYKAFLETHRIFEKAVALKVMAPREYTATEAALWEKLDRLRVQGMKYAERNCRTVHTGKIKWTPALTQAYDRVDFWNAMYRKLTRTRCKIDSRNLARKRIRAKVYRSTWSLEEVKQQRKMAYQVLDRESKMDVTNRASFNDSLAEAIAAAGDKDKAAVVKEMSARETQRDNARIIRFANNKMRSGSLPYVLAPPLDESDTRETVQYTNKEDMERALLRETDKRFRQAGDTAFLTEPLFSAIGPLADTEAAEAILNGTYTIPEGTDEYAAKLIPHLAIPDQVRQAPLADLELSGAAHTAGWKKQKERTSAGPSMIHFGHFIANSEDEDIAEMDAILSSFPFLTGYSPQRWQKGTQVMLPKQPGNFLVDRLRAILLYELDFNMGNKRIGRMTMGRAEAFRIIAMEQYGGRHFMAAIDHCFNKRLSFDLFRQKRLNATLLANDAKSCYDRIVHSIATLCMRRAGIPKEAMACMFKTIQNLVHNVRTIYGDSFITFLGSSLVLPIQGVGQGNGAGPPIWTMISTVVLDMLRAAGYGIKFQAALTGDDTDFVGYAFVDDTDLVSSPEQQSEEIRASVEQVIAHCQGGADLWEGGLRATGGALDPKKSHWVLVYFNWSAGKWYYANERQAPGEITIRGPTGQRETLKRLPVDKAERTLGVRLAVDGNDDAEFEYLLQRGRAWADGVRTNHIPRPLVWLSLTSTIMRTFQYPLPATTLSKSQCDEIMSVVLMAALPAGGVCRTFPRVVVYGPAIYHGMAVAYLYTEQGIAHIMHVLKYTSCKIGMSGELLLISLQDLKVEIGLPGSVFALPFSVFGSIATNCWLKHTWSFLSEYGMRISDSVSKDLPSNRMHDKYLTAEWVENGYRGHELATLNRCRMFLHVILLSDLCNAAGTEITSEAWSGERRKWQHSDIIWPAQGPIPPSDWDFWRQALSKCFTKGSTSRTLRRATMGQWTQLPTAWPWFFSPSEDRLYRQQEEQWYFWPKMPVRGSRHAAKKFRNADRQTCEEPAADLVMASILTVRSVLQMVSTAPVPSNSVTDRQSLDTLADRVRALPPNQAWAVRDIQIPADGGRTIAEAIRNGTAIAVSDGSFQQQVGTAAFTIEAEDKSNRISGCSLIPGLSLDHDSYRSEAGGIYGVAIMTYLVCQQFDITEGSITMGCDGIEALKHCTDLDWVLNPAKSHFDIVMATRSMIKATGIVWVGKHVKGHQDDDPWAVLDRWASMNVEMDLLAKAHLDEYVRFGNETSEQQEIGQEPWALWIGEEKIIRNIPDRVRTHVNGPPLLAYWQKNGRFHDAQPDLNWDATEKALLESTGPRRRWVSKHVAGMCGVAEFRKIWKQWSTDECPLCKTTKETAEHVWICPDIRQEVVWQKSLKKVQLWMEHYPTEPTMLRAIIANLKAWRAQQPTQNTTSTVPDLARAIAEQDSVGWKLLLEGNPVLAWEEIQQTYLTWMESRKTGRRWAIALIKKLWEVAWDLWEHRNSIVHDNKESIRALQLRQDIQVEFATGYTQLPKQVRSLFSPGLVSILQLSLDSRHAWLIRVRSARARQERRQASGFTDTYQRERAAMRQWLASANPPAAQLVPTTTIDSPTTAILRTN